jgi:hypothetical protein
MIADSSSWKERGRRRKRKRYWKREMMWMLMRVIREVRGRCCEIITFATLLALLI